MTKKFVSGAYRPEEDQSRKAPADIAHAVNRAIVSRRLRKYARRPKPTPQELALTRRICGERE